MTNKKEVKQPGSMNLGELIDLAEEVKSTLINQGLTEDVRFHLSPILDVVNQGKHTAKSKKLLEEAVIWLMEVHENLFIDESDIPGDKKPSGDDK